MTRVNAVGRRKTAVARVFLSPGKGDVTINKKPLKEYCSLEEARIFILQPLQKIDAVTQFDICINVKGGGVTGQSQAIRHGIARALCKVDIENRPTLKKEGYLTRDPRMVERKKPGQKKARKKFQFSKR